jgi:hypothetical protein
MLLFLAAAAGLYAQGSLLSVRRIHVDRLTGDASAAQIRDMIINALQSAGMFMITENPERADAFLRGSAEDLVFTDTFQSSEGIGARAAISAGNSSTRSSAGSRGAVSAGIDHNESTRIAERKHEAMAAVRLVDKNGDVIWATTKESLGAKFRGASADVADRVVKQLLDDLDKARAQEKLIKK